MLRQAGYALLNTAHIKMVGCLRIKVRPHADTVSIYVDCQALGKGEPVVEISADAGRLMDVLHEVEQLAARSNSAEEFARRCENHPFDDVAGCHVRLGPATESMPVPDPDEDVDAAQYVREIDLVPVAVRAFQDQGAVLRRNAKKEPAHYRLGWQPDPNGVRYAIFVHPVAGGWDVSAHGWAPMESERGEDFWEEFEIDPTWHISSGSRDSIDASVDSILSDISLHRGPDSAAPPEADYDDIDESADADEDDLDVKAYVASTCVSPQEVLTGMGYRMLPAMGKEQWMNQLGFHTMIIVWLDNRTAFDYDIQFYEGDTVLGGTQWQMVGQFLSLSTSSLRKRLEEWQHMAEEGTLFAAIREGRLAESADDVSAEELLATHKPRVYRLVGHMSAAGRSSGLGDYLTLKKAVEAAATGGLHNLYRQVWAEEFEADSLDGWYAVRTEPYGLKPTGVKHVIHPDGSTERVQAVEIVQAPATESARARHIVSEMLGNSPL